MEKMSQKIFTANGSWTAQAGVHFIEIEAIGGGGGGGAGANGSVNITESPLGGGGGGAGIMSKVTIAVTPGTTYDVIIGTAGAGGVHSAVPGVGGNGGDTAFQTQGGVVMARFVGGGGGQASNLLLDVSGYNTNGGKPANNPYVSSASAGAGLVSSPNGQPRIMIGEGGIGGDSNALGARSQGLAGSNALVYNATGFTGGARGAPGTDDVTGPYYAGGAGGGGAASYYGTGGAGGNGGNAADGAGVGAAGTAGATTVGASGSGGGGGGAGGSAGGGAGNGASGAAGQTGHMVIRWYE
jgi:hypothetical protein